MSVPFPCPRAEARAPGHLTPGLGCADPMRRAGAVARGHLVHPCRLHVSSRYRFSRAPGPQPWPSTRHRALPWCCSMSGLSVSTGHMLSSGCSIPPALRSSCSARPVPSGCSMLELELELIQFHMAQKAVLRGEVGARVLCVRSMSREEAWASAGIQGAWMGGCGCEAG